MVSECKYWSVGVIMIVKRFEHVEKLGKALYKSQALLLLLLLLIGGSILVFEKSQNIISMFKSKPF